MSDDPVAARWGDAAFTHALADASWMASVPVLMHLNERATGDRARDWLSSWAHRYFAGEAMRVLVLGCGEGWLERAIAAGPFVDRVDAVDISPEAVTRARAVAPPKISYEVLDLNQDTLEPDAYDVVVAHMVLHHVEHLEHAFEQIERTMKRDATLLVNEYTGPRRFQYGDDLLEMMNELRAALGSSAVVRPSEAFMIAHDPSEAVRSDELLPQLFARFEVMEAKKMGGTLLQHLLYEMVRGFRFDDPCERGIVEMLCTFEGALVDAQVIPSDFNILAARKRGSAVRAVNRPLPPRPAAASDIEPDPLRMRRRRVERRGGSPAARAGRDSGAHLTAWHLRLLRIVLASTQERRANLFEEQPMHAAMERLRFALAGSAVFEWIESRYRAYGSDPRILALLTTFDTLAPL